MKLPSLRGASRATVRIPYDALDGVVDDLAVALPTLGERVDRSTLRAAAEAFPVLAGPGASAQLAREKVRSALFGPEPRIGRSLRADRSLRGGHRPDGGDADEPEGAAPQQTLPVRQRRRDAARGAAPLTGALPSAPPEVDDLELDEPPRGFHRRLLRLGQDSLGRALCAPVLIARGDHPGQRFCVTAAVHGNELNGAPTIPRLFSETSLRRSTGRSSGCRS